MYYLFQRFQLDGIQITSKAFFFRQSHDAKHHGGNEGDAIDTVALDQGQEVRRLESLHQDHCGATQESLETSTERSRVVEGSGHKRHIPCVEERRGLSRIVRGLRRRNDEFGLSGASAGGQGSFVGRDAFG